MESMENFRHPKKNKRGKLNNLTHNDIFFLHGFVEINLNFIFNIPRLYGPPRTLSSGDQSDI